MILRPSVSQKIILESKQTHCCWLWYFIIEILPGGIARSLSCIVCVSGGAAATRAARGGGGDGGSHGRQDRGPRRLRPAQGRVGAVPGGGGFLPYNHGIMGRRFPDNFQFFRPWMDV